jgi:translation initiation factor 3 subunit J
LPLLYRELELTLIFVAVNSNDLKKLKNTLENLVLEKAKIEKGDKAKKNKGKGKAKLRIEGEGAIVNEYGAYEPDEFDDFM